MKKRTNFKFNEKLALAIELMKNCRPVQVFSIRAISSNQNYVHLVGPNDTSLCRSYQYDIFFRWEVNYIIASTNWFHSYKVVSALSTRTCDLYWWIRFYKKNIYIYIDESGKRKLRWHTSPMSYWTCPILPRV